MRTLYPILSLALAVACLALPPGAQASQLPLSAVKFAPHYVATFTKKYGAREVPVLRSDVVRAVSHSLESVGNRCSRELDVTIERASPTHPTMQQQLDKPSLDPFRTVYGNSGASLEGQVRDSSGHVLETVKYEYFHDIEPGLSPAKDPWSEARVAIDGFSHRLVDACVKHSASASRDGS